jgi:hypothetical protein
MKGFAGEGRRRRKKKKGQKDSKRFRKIQKGSEGFKTGTSIKEKKNKREKRTAHLMFDHESAEELIGGFLNERTTELFTPEASSESWLFNSTHT